MGNREKDLNNLSFNDTHLKMLALLLLGFAFKNVITQLGFNFLIGFVETQDLVEPSHRSLL